MTTQFVRPTIDLTLPSGKKAVIFSYITGGEMRKINSLYMEGLKASDFKSVEQMLKEVSVTTLLKAQELALSMLIVSIDGCPKEEAYTVAMEQLNEDDLEFLIDEVDKYTSGKTDVKKNSESSLGTSQETS